MNALQIHMQIKLQTHVQNVMNPVKHAQEIVMMNALLVHIHYFQKILYVNQPVLVDTVFHNKIMYASNVVKTVFLARHQLSAKYVIPHIYFKIIYVKPNAVLVTLINLIHNNVQYVIPHVTDVLLVLLYVLVVQLPMFIIMKVIAVYQDVKKDFI